MLARTSDGSTFATGAIEYNAAPDLALSKRVVLQVQIGGLLTEAFVDTDSQYIICTSEFAEAININADSECFDEAILIKGQLVEGKVYPVTVQFLADDDKGQSLLVGAYAFVIDEDAPLFTDEVPSSIGFSGCLESVCFAIDGGRRLFYFG